MKKDREEREKEVKKKKKLNIVTFTDICGSPYVRYNR